MESPTLWARVLFASMMGYANPDHLRVEQFGGLVLFELVETSTQSR